MGAPSSQIWHGWSQMSTCSKGLTLECLEASFSLIESREMR